FKNLYEANTADEYDNYFGQLVGYFIPPVTGDYVFLMSSDDHGETYLSTDADPANKKKIAEESGWSNRRIWLSDGVNDNTGSRGSEGAWVNRSDQYGGTEWPDGNTIHLIAGNRYYLEVLFKEGGGGDNGGATYKLASAADPANGTPSALTGNVVGTYVDPRTLPPLITQRPVGKHFAKGETVSLSVVAESASPVTYQWYQNKRAIAGATSSTLTIANADVKAVGDYYVDVTSKNGTVSSFPDDDVRLLMNGAFVIELEDFNYGSGQTVAAASTMPLAPNLYQGKDGIPGIDFRLANQSTTDAAANGNSLRNGWINSGTTVDFPTTSADLLGNVDVTGNDGDRDRGDFTIASNYKVGWNGSGEWYNYTRNFPAGNYNVLLGTSADGRAVDLFNDTLELVTGDPTKVNAATTVIGSLVGNGTGAWSSNDLLPYRNSDGSFAQVALGTGSTLRVRNSGSNDHDLDYLLLYPVGTITVPTLSYSTVGGVTTITYTGTLQSLDTLNSTPWTDVQGAVSPYQIPASTVQKYFRSRD
ncbi:MAG TPA: hypothetical protein DCE44_24785, partial [Verrucomicrobiales bacterium]|nr:hypothetical protein [Verrucomicrobiales bacterium]